jgi:hypothetical protein
MSGRLVKAKQPEVNKRYQCWVKIGGDMELLTVQVKRLYRAPYGNGRTTLYADVFGYGFSGTVQAKKLLKQDKVTA